MRHLDETFIIFDGYEIIGIKESWLTDRIPDAMIKFPNYTLFRQDRSVTGTGCKTNGGGILIYTKEQIAKYVYVIQEISNVSIDLEQM